MPYETFDLKYIPLKERSIKPNKIPEWQETINEILFRFSEIIDDLYKVIPEYSEHTEAFIHHEYTPFWIATTEVCLEFDLSDDLEQTVFVINTETYEIQTNEDY